MPSSHKPWLQPPLYETIKPFTLRSSEQCQRIKEFKDEKRAQHLTQILNYRCRAAYQLLSFIQALTSLILAPKANPFSLSVFCLLLESQTNSNSKLIKYYFHFSNQAYNCLSDRKQFVKPSTHVIKADLL